MLNMKKNKKAYIVLISILSITLIIFFINFTKNNYKNTKNGNNISNKTLDEVEEYILNISSYKATLEVTITSNKNTNKYILVQEHKQINGTYEDIQEVIEPDNIKSLKIIYKDGTIEIQNTKLNLNKIYNNYPYIEDNNLWLNSFIQEYKEAKNKKIYEEGEEIVLALENQKDAKIRYKELYLDRQTGKPTKLLIKDSNKNEIIYILYNEIEINYQYSNFILN